MPAIENPKISIIIVSLNGEKRLPMCFEALRNTNWENLEIIVVDNGSEDRTSEVTENEMPEAICIRAERNLGFAGEIISVWKKPVAISLFF